jgi:hypothetical protein
MSWNLKKEVKNVAVRRIDIVRTTPIYQLRQSSVINMGGSEGAILSGFSFEDIQIYDDITSLITFNV